jgi:hypothetical protein
MYAPARRQIKTIAANSPAPMLPGVVRREVGRCNLLPQKNVERLSLTDLKNGFENPRAKNILCLETIAIFSNIPPFSYEISPVCICRLFSVRLEMV